MSRLCLVRSLVATVVTALCMATQVFAGDVTLQIDGIPGDSRVVPGAIEVLSYSHGVSNPISIGSGSGGGAGKASFSDLNVLIPLTKSTPKLLEACVKGQHIPKAVLTVRKSGGKQQDYLVITMEDVLISSYQSSGGGDGDPTESMSMAFAKVKYAYNNADGVTEFSWNLETNSE